MKVFLRDSSFVIRTMFNVGWNCIRHPFSSGYIDPLTGKVINYTGRNTVSDSSTEDKKE